MFRVVFRPEEGKERVAAMRPARRGQREVAEEGDPLGLREDSA